MNVFQCISWLWFVSSAWDCPENSFCSPYGPGFFECSCLHYFHGYKCMRQVRPPSNHAKQVGRYSFIAHVHYSLTIAGRVSHSQGAWDTNRIYSCGFNFTLVHTKAKGQEQLSLKENWLLGWQWSHNMHQAYWKWCRRHQRVSYTGRYEPSTEHLSFLFFFKLAKSRFAWH